MLVPVLEPIQKNSNSCQVSSGIIYLIIIICFFFKYSVILYRFADFQIEMLKQFPQKAYIPLFHDYCAKKER